jgi:hypothetical protein
LIDDALSSCGVEFAIKRDDAAERGCWVGLEGAFIRGERRLGDRDAAGVGVLYDNAGRLSEFFDAF